MRLAFITMGGEVWVGVPVQCYMECNSLDQFGDVFGVIVLLKNSLLQKNSQIFYTLG